MDLGQVSDGKRYHRSDMAKLGCGDCEGCSACCRDMESVILDPWDIYRMTEGTKKTAGELLQSVLEPIVESGLIVLRLKMGGPENACAFLDADGRCGIHAFRPGICRLFPLGRIYEDDGFSYFLQIHECKKENRTKVKIEKWLGIPQLAKYEAYICRWHRFITDFQERFPHLTEEEQKKQNMLILQTFFLQPYEGDFYREFEERLAATEKLLRIG